MMLRSRLLRQAPVYLNSQMGAAQPSLTWKDRATDEAVQKVYRNKWSEKRHVPVQMRVSGDGGKDGRSGGVAGQGSRVLVDTRCTKGPYWHLAQESGAWCFIVYNKIYLAKNYVAPEDGGLLKEYEYLTEGVTLWDVGVERQTVVTGPDAEKFSDMVITRRAAACKAMQSKYVILTNLYGGILNDPIMLRPSENEFWFSLADSDITMYCQGVNAGMKMNVDIHELDIAPVQIQGPKAPQLVRDLCGDEVANIKYFDLARTKVAGCDVIVSRTGYSTEKGYEFYLYDATLNAEKMWYAIKEAGQKYNLQNIGPSHMRRIEAGMLSYGKDIDMEVNPYQCGLGWMVDLTKDDFIGKEALAKIKAEGVTHKLCGLVMGGSPIDWGNPDYYHAIHDGEVIGPVTSANYSPELKMNVGFARLPKEFTKIGTKLEVTLPYLYNDTGKPVPAEVVKTPFKMPDKEELGTGYRLTGGKLE